jgi:hypothetical protein
MTLKFYKEDDDSWYVDLPEWEGSKAELQMVSGADALCDILSHHSGKLTVTITEVLTPQTRVILHRWYPFGEGSDYGANYRADFENDLQSFDLWLCPVTLYVFEGEYPNVIYIS